MTRIQIIGYLKKWYGCHTLKMDRALKLLLAFVMGIGFSGCSDFVEVEAPKNILVSETVFNDPVTVKSTLANIYYGMREQGMVSGTYGLTTSLGVYSDELDYYGFDTQSSQFYQHTVLESNNTVMGWWANAYKLIYGANDIIKGVGNSTILNTEQKHLYVGQALIVRAYIHSLLVSLFGAIPYITSTDYTQNNVVARQPEEKVYANIISDLTDAIEQLDDIGEITEERVIPDHYAAKALLARMYLYTENWEMAEVTASELIDSFNLETDLDLVFLKESKETIWQLKSGETPRNTQEANQLIIESIPGQSYALTNSLLEAFEDGDQRLVHWVDSVSDTDSTITLYFAHKYKAPFTETESLEYSIIFRLAEQYLIRSEARARIGNLSGAKMDLNKIRNRAGLPDTDAVTEEDLISATLRERQVEFFAERGLRWFDLKRTGTAASILGPLKPGWKPTDELLPVPEKELEMNPNLLPQNAGY